MPTPDPGKKNRITGSGFFATLARDFAGSLLRLVAAVLIAFGVGTAAAGAACLYYGAPLIFALGGGVLAVVVVLGIAIALAIDTPF